MIFDLPSFESGVGRPLTSEEKENVTLFFQDHDTWEANQARIAANAYATHFADTFTGAD